MILECKNLVIGYENRVVLKGINFEINDGEYVCLFGDNGSGKSTLVKTILGLNSKSILLKTYHNVLLDIFLNTMII